MEVCIDTIESAKNAFEGGASRLELCSALSEGGLTPSLGLFKIIKAVIPIPVFVMLRPRTGNFTYIPEEKECIKNDAKTFLEAGADGFAFGALTEDGEIDIDLCQDLLHIVSTKPVTFHRAFDWTSDPYLALEQIIGLGFKRILTSGQRETAIDGLATISALVERAKDRIIIVPAAGINCDNILMIRTVTGVNEFHASARTNKTVSVRINRKCPMGPHDQYQKVTCVDDVRTMLQMFTSK